MTKHAVEVYAKCFEDEIAATVTAAKKVSEDARLRQAKEGKAHPLWLIGHLAFATDNIINRITLGGDGSTPQTYFKMFAPDILGGAAITRDASAYPTWDEVIAAYEKSAAAAVERIRSLNDEQLPGAVLGNPPEQFASFFSSLEAVLRRMLTHNAYHRGQLGMLAAL
jgi:uncharacterized damage-inducible protein DinB